MKGRDYDEHLDISFLLIILHFKEKKKYKKDNGFAVNNLFFILS